MKVIVLDIPSTHLAGRPDHNPLLRWILHVLVAPRRNSNPSLQVTVHVSLLVGMPSSPSEQSIIPLSGAVSVGHTVKTSY